MTPGNFLSDWLIHEVRGIYTKAFGTDRKLDGAVLQKDWVSKCNKSACEISKWLREQLLLKART